MSLSEVAASAREHFPTPLTRLIGRTGEMADVRALLRRDGIRLVTLTGPGGVGKTRLALEVAATLDDEFEQGVRLVSLAPVRSADLVLPAIAQALDVRDEGARPLAERLRRRLQDDHLLLIVDNVEHVVSAAPLLVDLLLASPRLRVLATSRIALHVSGEHEYPVPPLSVPDSVRPPAMPELSATDAVALFVQRAHAARPHFAISETNAPAVAEICRRLDGLPLAIELAAARVNVLSAQALLARLTNRLQILTGGPHDQPVRLQTMRNAIAWSYDLLDPDEQTLFRHLSIFVGGFALTAAEYVGGKAAALPPSVLDGLASLVDKSLVRRTEQEDGEPRFTMLETIREFGRQQLEASGEADAVHRRHAAHYLDLAEQAAPALTRPEQRVWLDLLAVEHGNLRAALGWFAGNGAPEELARLAWALWRFWQIRGFLDEGRSWLEQAAERLAGDPARAQLRAQTLYGAGYLAWLRGDQPAAIAHGEASLAIARALGDQLSTAKALGLLGSVANRQGDYVKARSFDEQALACHRAAGDPDGIAGSLNNLALDTLEMGAFDEAATLFEDARAVFASIGNLQGVATTLDNQSVARYCQDDVEGAEALAQQALDGSRRLGETRGVAIALDHIGKCARRRGEFDRSWACHQESLPLRRDIGHPRGIAVWLGAVAALIAARGDAEAAARLLGAEAALRDASGFPYDNHELIEHRPILAGVAATLGPDRFRGAWEAGRVLTPDAAVAEAFAAGEEATRRDEEHHPAPSPLRHPALTAREIDVLNLLAAGYGDRDIAATLFISHRTVQHHVARILDKLGVHTRTAATHAALAAGLLNHESAGRQPLPR